MDISHDHAVETYKSLMQYGSAGIKFVLTANGAAAIAVMTFLGHFVASSKADPPDMRLPLGLFLGGVVLGGVVTATAYFTQLALYGESIGLRPESKSFGHTFWLRVSIVLMLLGMAVFAAGSLLAVFRLVPSVA